MKRPVRKHSISVAAFVLMTAAALAGQTAEGWKLRADRSTRAEDPDAAGDIKLLKKGSGFDANAPQAAVFWNPANTASGSYSLKGTFTLMQPAGHIEYYGLVFGGSDLEGPKQTYLYFLVAQDGTWLIKRRDGDADTQNVSAKTASDAVKKPDASGKSTNALEVRVMPDKIDYFVNGTKVYTSPRSGLTAKTDGIYGFRVNHHLEVEVAEFGLSKL